MGTRQSYRVVYEIRKPDDSVVRHSEMSTVAGSPEEAAEIISEVVLPAVYKNDLHVVIVDVVGLSARRTRRSWWCSVLHWKCR